jgi:hypothetical protein
VCPGSHIRHVWGATSGRGVGRTSTRRPDHGGRGRLAQGASKPWGRSIKRTLQRRECVHRELPSAGGVLKASCGILGAPSLCRMGEGQSLRGRNRTGAPAGLSGVWAAAPRQGSVFNAGKVCVPAKTRPDGEDPAYNRITGSRREGRRLAAEAVGAMTARTTQPRSSKGPLGGRGRCIGEGPGVVPLGASTRRGAEPGWAALLHGRTPWHGEGGRPTRAGARGQEGRVGAPTVSSRPGNAAADRRSFAAGLGKTQRPVDRGAGGNQRQSARAARRQAPPAYPTSTR